MTDGDLSIFESSAILLHLGDLSDELMPADRCGRSDAKEWIFAALVSVEAASHPGSFFMFTGDADEPPMRQLFDDFLFMHRLKHMERSWKEANGWSGRFPWPTFSWRMFYGSSIDSMGSLLSST